MVIIKHIIFIALSSIVVMQEVEYNHISSENTFILIIDKSGSMSGDAIRDTKLGALKFISQIKKEDKVGVITFSNDISFDVPITSNRNAIKRGINSITTGGSTKLYDALAVGVKQLINDSNRRIIVYLTDGKDNGSNFGLKNLESMFQGENVFIYGLGVGDVDVESLTKISNVTGGNFHSISSDNTPKLANIYADVLTSFYTSYTNNISKTGSLIIKSIPKGKIVRINGENAGTTPLKLTNHQPENVTVEVYFENDKIWKKDIEIKSGYTASIRARERDALKNLWLISKPHGASIFIDGEYVGYTSNEIVNVDKWRWHKKVTKNPKERKIIGLKPGIHEIEVIGFPDFDYGPNQKLKVNYLLENDDIIFIDIFGNKIKNKSGKIIQGKQRKDIFDY